MWGESDGAARAPFGGVKRQQHLMNGNHPLAEKMQKLYYIDIEHDQRKYNCNVRRRNVKIVEHLMKGVRAGFGPMAYNIAELYSSQRKLSCVLMKLLSLELIPALAPGP